MFIQKGWHIHFGREPQIGNTQKRTQRAVDGTWTKGTMRASCLPEPWPNLSMEVCQHLVWTVTVDASGTPRQGAKRTQKFPERSRNVGNRIKQRRNNYSRKESTDPTPNGIQRQPERTVTEHIPLHLDSMSDGMKPRRLGGVLVTRLWHRICSTLLVWSFIILELFIFTHKTGRFEIKGTLHNATEASYDQLWSNWNKGGISSPVRNSESQHERLLLTPSVASPFHL